MFCFSPVVTGGSAEGLQLAGTAFTCSLAQAGQSWRLRGFGGEMCSEISLPGLPPALCAAALKSAATNACLLT